MRLLEAAWAIAVLALLVGVVFGALWVAASAASVLYEAVG